MFSVLYEKRLSHQIIGCESKGRIQRDRVCNEVKFEFNCNSVNCSVALQALPQEVF